VVDGTVATAHGDVAVDGDRIVVVGRVSGSGASGIDADGALSAWICGHPHPLRRPGDLGVPVATVAGNGVTTVLMVTAASVSRRASEHRDGLIELMEGRPQIQARQRPRRVDLPTPGARHSAHLDDPVTVHRHVRRARWPAVAIDHRAPRTTTSCAAIAEPPRRRAPLRSSAGPLHGQDRNR